MAGSRRSRERLSAAEARRVALAAQGFAVPRPADPDGRALRRVIAPRRPGPDRLGQRPGTRPLPALFARLGPYELDLVDRRPAYAPRRLFEYWGHEASLLPVATQPLLRWRMAARPRRRLGRDEAGGARAAGAGRRGAGDGAPSSARCRPSACRGRAAAPLRAVVGLVRRQAGVRVPVLVGQITSARRRNFERLYDLPERVLPRGGDRRADARPGGRAQRDLLRIAARALGVATERDLRDYFRLPLADARGACGGAGRGRRAAAGGRRGLGHAGLPLAPGRRVPRSVDARALIGPFDSLIWERSRVERLFGFRYRIEIYVPEAEAGARLLRAALPAGRPAAWRAWTSRPTGPAGELRVQAAHAEPDAPPETAAALAEELRAMAGWLGLERVKVGNARRPGGGAPAACQFQRGCRGREPPAPIAFPQKCTPRIRYAIATASVDISSSPAFSAAGSGLPSFGLSPLAAFESGNRL